MSGAQKLRIDERREFVPGDHCVAVQRAEGTVQLLVTGLGCGANPPLLMNLFAAPETAGQLRSLAAFLEQVPELKGGGHAAQ